MTALAGYWALNGASSPLAGCERMLKAQQIYGPDPALCRAEGALAIGLRRFRTLPEDGFDRGPLIGSNGRGMLVADVRIDDRSSLCEALGIGAAEARGASDSRLLLCALERWGEAAVDRLVGDFAFAWWNGERLVLARDFLGQRPLHFHRGDGIFAFASMPKGLHALPECPVAPDTDRLAELLALMPEGETQSYFKGVERVPAGHICIADRSGVSLRRYWNPSPAPLRLRRPSDYAEAVREQFDRAVSARLRGAGAAVGAHLSVGLDSSAVAASAARLLAPERRVVAFTSVPPVGYSGRIQRGRFADEGPLAAEVASLYPNIDHVLIRTAGISPLAGLDRNFFLYDRPVLNLCNNVWSDAILDSAKERGLNVMLNGAMGNMSFSYTGLELLPELLRGGRWLRLARLAVKLRRNGIRLESVAAHSVGPFLPAWLWTAINALRGRRLTTCDYSAIDSRRVAGLRDKAERAGLDLSYRPRRNPVATRLWVLGRVDPGNYNKGQLGGWGIDARDPTADRRLVELCLAIPPEQYLLNGVSRSLARRAFADRLPRSVVDETRKGYQAADWHEGLAAALGPAREEVGRIAAAPGAEGMIDTKRMRRLLDDWPQGDWNSHTIQANYRLAVLRGLSTGHFLRKASGSNS